MGTLLCLNIAYADAGEPPKEGGSKGVVLPQSVARFEVTEINE